MQPFESPEAMDRALEIGARLQDALITSVRISEPEAEKIVKSLWPGSSLLGATSGRGFSITTAEQVAVINETLAPGIFIRFNPEKHVWSLQTWPE